VNSIVFTVAQKLNELRVPPNSEVQLTFRRRFLKDGSDNYGRVDLSEEGEEFDEDDAEDDGEGGDVNDEDDRLSIDESVSLDNINDERSINHDESPREETAEIFDIDEETRIDDNETSSPNDWSESAPTEHKAENETVSKVYFGIAEVTPDIVLISVLSVHKCFLRVCLLLLLLL
jgi:hypothetical protein